MFGADVIGPSILVVRIDYPHGFNDECLSKQHIYGFADISTSPILLEILSPLTHNFYSVP